MILARFLVVSVFKCYSTGTRLGAMWLQCISVSTGGAYYSRGKICFIHISSFNVYLSVERALYLLGIWQLKQQDCVLLQSRWLCCFPWAPILWTTDSPFFSAAQVREFQGWIISEVILKNPLLSNSWKEINLMVVRMGERIGLGVGIDLEV